jgi:hypothetical protein
MEELDVDDVKKKQFSEDLELTLDGRHKKLLLSLESFKA